MNNGPLTEASATTAKHCAGVRRDGQPCAVKVLVDGSHCFAHVPGRDQARAEARARGGRNRSTTARLRGLVPPRLVVVYDRLERALEETHDGTLDPKQATAMAALARAMTNVLQTGEFEERLRRLEGTQGA